MPGEEAGRTGRPPTSRDTQNSWLTSETLLEVKLVTSTLQRLQKPQTLKSKQPPVKQPRLLAGRLSLLLFAHAAWPSTVVRGVRAYPRGAYPDQEGLLGANSPLIGP